MNDEMRDESETEKPLVRMDGSDLGVPGEQKEAH
jgi:hypothetical protein